MYYYHELRDTFPRVHLNIICMKQKIRIILLALACLIIIAILYHVGILDLGEAIGSFVISIFAGLLVELISMRNKNPEDSIGRLQEQINKGKDPSKIEKKIEKLENEIENNPKIQQEEKERLSKPILELKEGNSKQFLDRGLKSYREVPPNLDSALEDFNKAIEQNPHNAEAFYYRGVLKAEGTDKNG